MEMAKSLQAVPMFNQFIDSQLRQKGAMKKRVLLDAAANDFRLKTKGPGNPDGNSVTQQMLSRYLDQRTNDVNGDLEEYDDAEADKAIKFRPLIK
jgi:hypothetical protein